MRHIAGWALRLLLALALVPVGLLTVAACAPCPPGVRADLRAEQRTEDVDIGDLLKQSEKDKKRADQTGQKQPGKSEPNGGVNARGNGGPPAGCPPGGGKPGSNKMLGANGPDFRSKTVLETTQVSSKYSYRIDVENPNPGERPGNIHVQLGGKGSTHYYWRGDTRFTTKDGEALPKRVQKHIDESADAKDAIQDALRLLGEK